MSAGMLDHVSALEFGHAAGLEPGKFLKPIKRKAEPRDVFPVDPRGIDAAGFATTNLMIWKAWQQVMVPRPDAKINVELIKKHRPTFVPGVPTMFVGMLADPDFRKLDFSSVKGSFL